jgi:hypothetical protein
MTGVLRGAAIIVAGSLVAVAPAVAASADSKLPAGLATPAAPAPHAPTTTSGGLSPQVTALAADAPNTIPAVTTTSANNAWLSEAIQSSGDNDIYRFFNAQSNWVRILLGDQVFSDGAGEHANDYAVILYDRNSHEIARSTRASGIAEEIYLPLSRNYYYVRVLRQTGGLYEAPTHPYVVRFQQYKDGMAFNGLHLYQVPATGGWYLAGEALNNTSQYRKITLAVTVNDASNRVLKTATGTTFHAVVPPRGRSPFQFTLGKLAVTPDHYVTRIAGAPVAASGISGLSISTGTPTQGDPGGPVTFPGTITNIGSVTRTQVRVGESLFSTRGELLYLGFEPLTYTLVHGQRHAFAVRVSVVDGTVAIRNDYTGR